MKIVIIDPPEGWKYGFPAPLKGTLENTLAAHNYPRKMWGLAREYSRFWVENTEPPKLIT